MGLDLVEYVMAAEAAFGVELPDERLREVATVRQLAALVAGAVGAGPGGACLSQRAFHRVRAALVRHARVQRRAVRPDAVLDDLLPAPGPARDWAWAGVRGALGPAPDVWLVGRRSWSRALGARPTTVADLADDLLARNSAALRDPGSPWTEPQVRDVLLRLLQRECGVPTRKPDRPVLDAHLVRDLGIS